MKTYLPEDILALSDRLSMWHSLEVRVPLVDHPLVELSARLPARYKLNWRRKKILLKQLAARRLPAQIVEHRKQGFESPMAAWLRTDLADYAQDILGQGRLGRDVPRRARRGTRRTAANARQLFRVASFRLPGMRTTLLHSCVS
jgi:asparagine synthetase B (glutamine-hydrolysing)